jgi:hypothetical protein
LQEWTSNMIQVWSCGGGTQSGAIAALIARGKLSRPDYAFMTDTGRERSSTWPFVEGFIRPALASANLELTIVKAADYARLDLFSPLSRICAEQSRDPWPCRVSIYQHDRVRGGESTGGGVDDRRESDGGERMKHTPGAKVEVRSW